MSGIIANTSDVSWVAESGDCINRQDAINVAIQAADDWDGGYNLERAEMIERGLKMLPALQAESCEDAISREAVHEMLENIPVNESDKWFNWLQRACLRLAELPSVQSTRPNGEWIFTTEGNIDHITCSVCGHDSISNFDYCPNCGCYNGR